jgi:DNA-binding GntR family transcriptional regulator
LPTARRVIVKQANTAERVAEVIRQAISNGELSAGEHVRQEVWAQRLSVSRAPTREAMKMLVSERLLSYETHRGYFVTKLEPHEMAQVYLIRLLLETEILRTIRWPNDSELADLHKVAEETHELLKTGFVHEAMGSARRLAFEIFDLSPLTFVANEVKRYWDIADEYRALGMGRARASDPSADGLKRRHVELFAALETQDRKRLIKHNTAWRRSMVERWGVPLK